MKKILFVAAMIPIAAYVLSHLSEQLGRTVFAGLMCLPVLGMFYLPVIFARWHRGFHASMRVDGILRRHPPSK